jgi:hypothetical protein
MGIACVMYSNATRPGEHANRNAMTRIVSYAHRYMRPPPAVERRATAASEVEGRAQGAADGQGPPARRPGRAVMRRGPVIAALLGLVLFLTMTAAVLLNVRESEQRDATFLAQCYDAGYDAVECRLRR